MAGIATMIRHHVLSPDQIRQLIDTPNPRSDCNHDRVFLRVPLNRGTIATLLSYSSGPMILKEWYLMCFIDSFRRVCISFRGFVANSPQASGSGVWPPYFKNKGTGNSARMMETSQIGQCISCLWFNCLLFYRVGALFILHSGHSHKSPTRQSP